jgi:hypothetical protein
MQTKFLLKFTLLAIFLYSCNQKDYLDAYLIAVAFDRDNEIQASSFIESFKIIQLSTDDDNLIHQVSKVQYVNDKIFILDIPGNAIFIYNKDGSLYHKIRRVGGGPGEYAQIMDFFVSESNLYILDFVQQAIIKLNEGLEFVERIRLQTFSSYFARYDNFFWAYNEASPKRRDYQFSHISDDGWVVSEFLPRTRSDNQFNWAGSNVFYRNSSELYLSPRFGNTIYRIEDNNIVPIFNINFGRHQFPRKDNVNNHDITVLDFPFLLRRNFFLSDKFLIFDYIARLERYFNVYDRIADISVNGIVNNDLIENFRFFPRWGNDHYLIEALDPEHLLNEFSGSLQLANSVNLNTVLEDDNPLIIIYELKQ